MTNMKMTTDMEMTTKLTVQVCVRVAYGDDAQNHLGLHVRVPKVQLQASHLQLADARRIFELLQLWSKHSRYAHLRPPGYSNLRQHTAGPAWPAAPPGGMFRVIYTSELNNVDFNLLTSVLGIEVIH
jgi:hypothetical protein